MTFRAWFVCVVILNKAPKRRNWKRGKSEQRGPTKVFSFLQIKAFDNFPKSRSLQWKPSSSCLQEQTAEIPSVAKCDAE